MPSQVVWPEMDSYQVASLFDYDPNGGISEGKDPLVSGNPSVFEEILQPVSQLLGDEHYFRDLSAFGIPDGEFLIIHIHSGKLQYLAHSHTSPGHELQHEAVSHLGSSEDDLVNHFFFVDLPWSQLSGSEKLPQHGGIAGVLELLVQVVSDEVKEGLEIRVTGVLGELLTGIVEAG